MSTYGLHQRWERVRQGLSQEHLDTLAPLFAELAHDLNNQAGTLSLELFSLDRVLNDLKARDGCAVAQSAVTDALGSEQNLRSVESALVALAALLSEMYDEATADEGADEDGSPAS